MADIIFDWAEFEEITIELTQISDGIRLLSEAFREPIEQNAILSYHNLLARIVKDLQAKQSKQHN